MALFVLRYLYTNGYICILDFNLMISQSVGRTYIPQHGYKNRISGKYWVIKIKQSYFKGDCLDFNQKIIYDKSYYEI